MIEENTLIIQNCVVNLGEIFAECPFFETYTGKINQNNDILARCVQKSLLSSKIKDMLLCEKEYLQKYNSPHLIKFMQIIENEKYLIFIYQKSPTEKSLRNFISKMNFEEVKEFLRQIMNIICALRIDNINVIFLNPDSIYVSQENDTKIYKLGTLIGTTSLFYTESINISPYFAPELSVSSAWSLGVLLKMLPLPYLNSDSYSHLLKRCLEKDPSKRIPLEDIMFHPFMNSPEKLSQNYTIIKLIGESDFAERYLALNKKTNENVMIKVAKIRQAKLSLKFFDSNTMLKYLTLLEHEISLLYNMSYFNSQDSSKSVVLLKDNFFGDNTLYFIFEFCQGVSLANLIEKYPDGLPLDLLIKFAKNIIKCIKNLHEMQIVHRHLTPRHILLTNEDPYKSELKITDFAHALKLLNGIGNMEHLITDQTYIPPEAVNVENDFEISFSYDIWSFGIILYEMTYGIQPIFIEKSEKDRQALKINLMQKGEFRTKNRVDINDTKLLNIIEKPYIF